MVHNDSIAHGDSIDLERDATTLSYACFHILGNIVQVDVSRDNLAVAIYNADERFVHLRAIAAKRI
jgi:hypothetical protein